MAAVRIVEEQKNVTALKRVRLAVHGDRLGGFRAGQMRECVTVAGGGEDSDRGQHYCRSPLAAGRARPDTGDNRGEQHRAVLEEKRGIDGSFDYREATA